MYMHEFSPPRAPWAVSQRKEFAMKEERRSKHSNAVSRPTLLVVVITLIGLASASEAGGGQTNINADF
jgi:hypothetical protein